MHLYHLQGVLSFYSAKVIKIIRFTKSIKSVDQNVYVFVIVNGKINL